MVSLSTPALADSQPQSLELAPAQVQLNGPRLTGRVIATGRFNDDTAADLTRRAVFSSSNPDVAQVNADGRIVPQGNGEAEIIARVDGFEARTRVVVQNYEQAQPVDFRTEVIGGLSRGGCNQGACHGSPQGKNGFRLSLRGFQPELDIVTLTRENFGRRANRYQPDESLFLRKVTGQIPHQGGRRFRESEPAYQLLHQWVAQGSQDSAVQPKLQQLQILPGRRVLRSELPNQQILALAHFDDGTVRDVTHLAVFESSDDALAGISADGLLTFQQTAEVAVLVRYLDKIESLPLTYVRRDSGFEFAAPAPVNAVDEHVFAKHKSLQLNPSPVANDAVFLRRVFLDVTGALPTPEQARAFLDSQTPDKRNILIDQLLDQAEYAQLWALKWADVMRGNRESITQRGVHGLHRYLVRVFAEDKPFDELAREVLTSQGNTIHNPPANFFRISREPTEAAESMAQLFLGVRIQCARCHNHPYESITQNDYYGLSAYFARVKLKGQKFGLDDEIVYLARDGEVKHLGTGEIQPPAAFGTPAGELGPHEDRRERLADWLAAADNPYFARSTVNRVWYHLFGRGIVEPVDDFRDSNPPANADLLNYLADQFIAGGYRIKPIIRMIVQSRTYQLSAQPVSQSDFAADGEKYFTHTLIRMLSAEQILDAISSATGIPETFPGYPPGTRAIALAEGSVDHNFLKAFSKPVRDVACDCARETEPSLNQVMHLINNPEILEKLQAPAGRLARLLAAQTATNTIVEELYLATLCRRPTPGEIKLANSHVSSFENREEGLRDMLHALLNTNEFLLRH